MFKWRVRTVKKKEPYQLLMYVEDSCPRLKKFRTMEEASKFVTKFQKKYPDHMAMDSGYWIDFLVQDVSGEVSFFTDGIEIT